MPEVICWQKPEMNQPLTPHPSPTAYQAVMVRLWRAGPDAPCRASVQLSPDDEPMLFPDLPSLFVYLARLAGETAETPPPTQD